VPKSHIGRHDDGLKCGCSQSAEIQVDILPFVSSCGENACRILAGGANTKTAWRGAKSISLKNIQIVGPTEATVLILGETGTENNGHPSELPMAREHTRSSKCDREIRDFISQSCSGVGDARNGRGFRESTPQSIKVYPFR